MTPISSIPVLIHEHALSLEKTVRMVVEEMHLSLEEFQRAVESFKIKSREVGYTDVDEFISIFETFQTGQFRWTAESPRFGVQKFLAKDGTYLIPL